MQDVVHVSLVPPSGPPRDVEVPCAEARTGGALRQAVAAAAGVSPSALRLLAAKLIPVPAAGSLLEWQVRRIVVRRGEGGEGAQVLRPGDVREEVGDECAPEDVVDILAIAAAAPAAPAAPDADDMEISVTTVAGPPLTLRVGALATVRELQELLCARLGLAPEQQRLIAGGRVMDARQLLCERGVRDGSTVHLVFRMAAGGAVAAAAPAAAAAPRTIAEVVMCMPSGRQLRQKFPCPAGSLPCRRLRALAGVMLRADAAAPQPPARALPDALLREMLAEEDRLRVSEDTQRLYAAVERTVESDWMEVTHELQLQVVRAFPESVRLCGSEEAALLQLRCGAVRHPDLARYVRYNRAHQGGLRVGDLAPDVPALPLGLGTAADAASDAGTPRDTDASDPAAAGGLTSLYALLDAGPPVALVVAGSYS